MGPTCEWLNPPYNVVILETPLIITLTCYISTLKGRLWPRGGQLNFGNNVNNTMQNNFIFAQIRSFRVLALKIIPCTLRGLVVPKLLFLDFQMIMKNVTSLTRKWRQDSKENSFQTVHIIKLVDYFLLLLVKHRKRRDQIIVIFVYTIITHKSWRDKII